MRSTPPMARVTSQAISSSSVPAATSPSCSTISCSDMDTAVSGLRRSWLTWPAKAASCSLDRSQLGVQPLALGQGGAQLAGAQLQLEQVDDPVGQRASAVLLLVGQLRGCSSKTHRVPITSPDGRDQLVGRA